MSQEIPTPILLNRLHRVWSRIEDACAAVAALLIAMAMVLTVVEVLSRKLLNFPLPGIIDTFNLGMAAIAFLGASQCQRMSGHVRMEMVVRRLSGRALWCVESITTLIALGFVSAVGLASADGVARAYRVGDATMDLLLPVWPSKALITLALVVLAGRLALQFFDSLRLIMTPDAEPIAALPVASVEELAREEIEATGKVDTDGSDRGAGV
ncbi:MAG: TRAP transporter small permease subunit [Alphaproteobacteria bacterium]|nr:TRAP transporter small permease subunit [Alphaproteobacteria bacterium]